MALSCMRWVSIDMQSKTYKLQTTINYKIYILKDLKNNKRNFCFNSVLQKSYGNFKIKFYDHIVLINLFLF